MLSVGHYFCYNLQSSALTDELELVIFLIGLLYLYIS